MVVTVYTDQRTNELLEDIKKINPDFIIADFFRKALEREFGENNEALILRNLAEIESTMSKSQRLKEVLLNKLTLLKQENQNKIKIQEEKKTQEQLEAEKKLRALEYRKKTVTTTFKEELGRDMTEQEYQDFETLCSRKIVGGIFDYCNFIRSKKK